MNRFLLSLTLIGLGTSSALAEPTPSRSPDPDPPPAKRKVVTTGAGVSNVWLESPGRAGSETLFTARVSISQPVFTDSWTLGAGAYGTIATLGRSDPTWNDRFLGLNLRLGYTLPLPAFPWRISLNGGYFYTACYSSTPGYGHVGGVQVFPTLAKVLRSRSILSLNLKYAPVSDNWIASSGNSREVAYGVGWIFPPFEDRSAFALGLDSSDLIVRRDRNTFRVRTWTLGASYRF